MGVFFVYTAPGHGHTAEAQTPLQDVTKGVDAPVGHNGHRPGRWQVPPHKMVVHQPIPHQVF